MRRLWILAFFLFSLQLWAGAPRAMIIFDASGSMWGQVDGERKIDIARRAMRDLLRDWNPQIPLGLTVYGHRRKGDCNDIETPIPVGPLDRQRMIRAVEGIRPKGKTPIARALKRVAAQFRGSEDPATIILISDGKESCDADPCATARELRKSGIRFVAHVIGFHVDRTTDRQLACIARATGGSYFSARNAAALNRAITQVAKKITRVTKIEARPKKAAKLPASVTLTALGESDRRGTVKTVGITGVHWWVWQDGKAVYADNDPMNHQPEISLHSGEARVRMLYPDSSEPQTLERNVTLQGGKNRIVFYLKDGGVTIEALDHGARSKSSVHLYPIIKGKVDESKEADWCITSPRKGCSYHLPIGRYYLKGTCKGQKLEGEITVRENEEQTVRLDCNAGK
ncbi:vWA domain-containing protein [Nitratifractor salsuginis]|uniref:von Willebrand factor type A n=1 Tax=Nitratifractor salsuginis (strain DSM 16511 / JCM 12458 / E9I37-1) TaxID=749222 RepID=E6WXR1_NITSE|nr:VWA domain-containing protein [Nitratifractor salsuginis]ADV46318.1 von Willebrand factor type A [Nitratifractor salsuginis DSM 16511]